MGKVCMRNKSVKNLGKESKPSFKAQPCPSYSVQTLPILGLLSQMSAMEQILAGAHI